MQNNKIGIIGFGNMGSAIAERIKVEHKVFVFDKDEGKLKGVTGITVIDNIKNLVKNSDAVILAVKPQDFDALLEDIKDKADNKLIISIAAGVSTSRIENILDKARVVRVMPNIGAIVGKATSCLSKGKLVDIKDMKFAESLFRKIGDTLIINEDKMNAATAVSGSGPGYLYYLIEGKSLSEAKKYAHNIFMPSLKEAAVKIGFNPDQAQALAQATTEGSMAVLARSDLSAGQLKLQVASKGGTTEAGLSILFNNGSIEAAVLAAKKRAEELSK